MLLSLVVRSRGAGGHSPAGRCLNVGVYYFFGCTGMLASLPGIPVVSQL